MYIPVHAYGMHALKGFTNEMHRSLETAAHEDFTSLKQNCGGTWSEDNRVAQGQSAHGEKTALFSA